MRQDSCGLKKLDLLVLAQYKLGCFSPVGRVFPTMFYETRRVPIDLEG